MKTYIHILLLAFIPTILFAQQQRTLHQTFEIEEVERINFNLYDEIEFEKWAGNTILTETKVEVHDATKGIFDHFVNGGRYEIVMADKPGAKPKSPEEQYEVNADYFEEGTSGGSTNEVEEEPEPEVEETTAEAGIYFNSKDAERKPIRTRTGECMEVIKIRIFIPEDFNRSGQNSYFRSLPDEEED